MLCQYLRCSYFFLFFLCRLQSFILFWTDSLHQSYCFDHSNERTSDEHECAFFALLSCHQILWWSWFIISSFEQTNFSIHFTLFALFKLKNKNKNDSVSAVFLNIYCHLSWMFHFICGWTILNRRFQFNRIEFNWM